MAKDVISSLFILGERSNPPMTGGRAVVGIQLQSLTGIRCDVLFASSFAGWIEFRI